MTPDKTETQIMDSPLPKRQSQLASMSLISNIKLVHDAKALRFFLVCVVVMAAAFDLSVGYPLFGWQETELSRDASENKLSIPFVYRTGDEKEYQVVRTNFRGGTRSVTSKSVLRLKIMAVTDEGVALSASNSLDIDRLHDDSLVADEVRKIADLFRDVKIDILVSHDGVVQCITDSSQLDYALQKLESEIERLQIQSGVDQETRNLVARTRTEFAPKQGMTEQYLVPINLLLMMCNGEFEIGKTITRESTSEVFLAKNVPTVEKFDVINVDRDNNRASIRYAQTVSGEPAAKMVRESFLAALKRVSPDERVPELIINDMISEGIAETTVDLSTGWPTRIRWKTRMVNMTDGQLHDKQEFLIESVDLRH